MRQKSTLFLLFSSGFDAFCPCIHLALLMEIRWLRKWGLFMSAVLFHWCIYGSLCQDHSLVYWSFLYRAMNLQSLQLWPSFRDYLHILDLSQFHINLRIHSWISAQWPVVLWLYLEWPAGGSGYCALFPGPTPPCRSVGRLSVCVEMLSFFPTALLPFLVHGFCSCLNSHGYFLSEIGF